MIHLGAEGRAGRCLSAAAILALVALCSGGALAGCIDADADGFFGQPECGTPVDCNDEAPSIHPTAPESCDAFDNDCNGEIDEDPGCLRTCAAPRLLGQDIPLSGPLGVFGSPHLISAWTGGGYGLTWAQSGPSGEEVRFALLDVSGVPVGTDVPVFGDAGFVRGPSMAWTGSGYGIAWWDVTTGVPAIRFLRLDTAGHPLGEPMLVSDAAGARWPWLTWTGVEFGIVWEQGTAGPAELRFARVDAQGTRIGDVVPLAVGEGAAFPRLVWSGSDHAVAWTRPTMDGPVRRLARLDATGTVIEPGIDVGPGTLRGLVWTGLGYKVLGDHAVAGRLVMSHLDGSGALERDDTLVTTTASSESTVSTSWTGEELAIAWIDLRETAPEIRVGRFDPLGQSVDTGFRATMPPVAPSRPSLAWSGSALQLIWLDNRPGELRVRGRSIACECFDQDGDGSTNCDDCNDDDPEVFPGAEEVCDSLSNDCNDPAWPLLPPSERDVDQDGFRACEDCDDDDDRTRPGAPEVCDGVNNDCDSFLGWPTLPASERDSDQDGFRACEECHDGQPTIRPGAPEVCDGFNNDCDDPSWPALPATERDTDQDGFRACIECDDGDGGVYPGAPEVCDGVNNDCDDPGWPAVGAHEIDADGDTFQTCAECDDGDAAVHPGAPEVCDGVNNDCDDPLWPDAADALDADSDGATVCDDCDEMDAGIFPGAPQSCDGVNNDCNDPLWPFPPDAEVDVDFDLAPACDDCDDSAPDVYPGAFDDCDGLNNDCDHPAWPTVVENNDEDADGASRCDGDCADGDPAIHPGAVEACDGFDNDCDGLADDLPGCPTLCDAGDQTDEVRWTGYMVNTTELATVSTGAQFGVAVVLSYPFTPTRIRLVRFTADGSRIGETPLATAVPDGLEGVQIAWTGAEYAVAWVEPTAGVDTLYLARVDTGGTQIGAVVPVVSGETVATVAFAWDGSGYGFVWRDGSFVQFARTDAAGMLLAPPTRLSTADGFARKLLWTGAEYAAVWTGNAQNPAILLARVGANGRVLSRRIVARPDFQGSIDLAWNGSEYGLLWSERPAGVRPLRFARLDALGRPYGDEILLAEEAGLLDVALEWTGLEYGVTWTGSVETPAFARLDATGAILSTPFGAVAGASLLRPLWTGTEYRLIYTAIRNSSPFNRENVFSRLVFCGCPDRDGDGFGACLDCGEGHAGVYPGAFERCNGLDDDCDELADEGLSATVCDLDDGRISIGFSAPDRIAWQEEHGFDAWNVYRGSLAALRAFGEYTQEPGSNAIAARDCGLATSALDDPFVPDAGAAAFYLVTGSVAGVEGSLGDDSEGVPRPNAHPCP